jgi:hypothetical protein
MPAFSAIGAYVAGTLLSLGGAAVTIAGVGLSLGGALVASIVATGAAFITSRIINGNPNKGVNSAMAQGGRVQIPPATNNKIPVVYGNAYINGVITDAKLISLENKVNDVMYYCIVLSETCNDESAVYTVDDVYWNDLRLTYLTGTTETHIAKDGRKNVNDPDPSVEDFIDTNFIVDKNRYVEMRIYAGGSTAADQIFPTNAGNKANAYNYWGSSPANPNGDGSWTSRNEMKGLVYAIVRVRYNGEKGFTGLPNVTFRLNNSVSNPADVWLDYMTSQRYGAGIDLSYIDTSAKTAWKNFCDEDINYTNKAGLTEQVTTRYSINGVIDTSRPVKDNIDTIMQNAGAWLSYNVATGYWSPIIKKAVTAGEIGQTATYFTASRTGSTLTVTNFPSGRIEAGQKLYNSSGTLIGTISAQLTPTAGETAGQKGRYTTSTSGSITSTTFYTLPATMLSFSDDNIISGISISSTRLDDLYNNVEAEFYDKNNKDQKAYARNEISADERNPNEPDNQLRLSLDLCNNSMQADILGQLELRQSRDDLVIEFTATHYGIQAQAGDVVSVYSELYDWAPKYFRVMRVKEQETEDGGLIANIQALEYNPDVYTVEQLTEFTTSANIGIGVYGSSPNLPEPPVVFITEIDTNVAIPNFQLQIQIPTTGGPYDEIELYYTEGWDPMDITGWIDNNSTPGTYSGVAGNIMTVTATPYGAINAGDYFDLGGVEVVNQLTNNPVSKTYSSGGVIRTNTVVLNNVTGLKIGNNLMGTGLGASGSHITAINAGTNTVTLDRAFDVQAAGTYTVTGGLGTYTVNTTIATQGTDTLYDLPLDSDYVYLKKYTPEGNVPTFTNGETVTITITEVPANTQTYRRWFIKARMGIKKRFGKFSTPTTTNKDGNFRYTPSPTGGGSLNDLTDVDITNPNEGQTLYYDATTSKWINNSILEIDDSATFGGIVVGQGVAQPMITFPTQTDGANSMYGIRGKSTVDDPWFIGAGSTGDDLGYLEIATGDNAGLTNSGGQIYVRQYNGASPGTGVPWFGGNGTVVNELTLLDNAGNTVIPNNLTVNNGVLFVDATNNRVGINNTSPSYELHIDNGTDSITQFAMTNNERSFIVTNNGGDDLLSFNYGGANRLQFNATDQWFNSGKLGVNDSTPSYTLDVNGDLRAVSDAWFDANARVTGNLAVNGGSLTTTQTTFNLLNSTATTLNIGGASTTTNIGSTASGTTTIGWDAVVNKDLAVNGGDITTTQTTFNLLNTTATTVNIGGASTATNIGAATGTTTIGNDLAVRGTNLILNSDGTGTENVFIKVERGSTDAMITWYENDDLWDISNSVDIETNLVVGNDLTVTGDLTQITTTTTPGPDIENKNIITSAIWAKYNNSYWDPGVYHTIDSWSRTDYKSAKYILNVENTTDTTRYQIIELLIVAGSGTPYMTVYGDLFNDGSQIMLQVIEDSVYDPGVIQLQAYALFPPGISGGVTRITGQRILFAKAT